MKRKGVGRFVICDLRFVIADFRVSSRSPEHSGLRDGGNGLSAAALDPEPSGPGLCSSDSGASEMPARRVWAIQVVAPAREPSALPENNKNYFLGGAKPECY